MRDRVEKNAAPGMTTATTARMARGCQFSLHPDEPGQEVDDGHLGQGAHPGGQGFAQHQGAAGGGADQELVDQAQVPLPDDGDAVEDGDEQDALGEDAGGHEVEVAQVARWGWPGSGEHLAEDQQPQGRLDGPGEQFGGVVAQLPGFEFGDNQGLFHETAY